jgi:hypothetical protein
VDIWIAKEPVRKSLSNPVDSVFTCGRRAYTVIFQETRAS